MVRLCASLVGFAVAILGVCLLATTQRAHMLRHERRLQIQQSAVMPQADVEQAMFTLNLTSAVMTASGVPPRGALQLPIFHVGFPKMGTSSMHDYFRCHGLLASHHQCGKGFFGKGFFCGPCLNKAFAEGNPDPLGSCGKYEAWIQMDYSDTNATGRANHLGCAWPQFQHLEELAQRYPNATWLLNTRPLDHWVKSLFSWGHGGFSKRILACDLPGLPPNLSADKNADIFKLWLARHFWHVEEVVQRNPGLVLVRTQIEAPDTEQFLKATFGALFRNHERKRVRAMADKGCWRHSNKR